MTVPPSGEVSGYGPYRPPYQSSRPYRPVPPPSRLHRALNRPSFWIAAIALVALIGIPCAMSASKLAASRASQVTAGVRSTPTSAPFRIVPGATGRKGPGCYGPVNEGIRYMYDRADQERDSKGRNFAIERYEWVFPKDGDRLEVIQVKGNVAQIEMLNGESRGRRLWVHSYCIDP